MKVLRQDTNTTKLRNTLNQLKQFTTRDYHKNHIETPTIGITLISLQKYKNKRKIDKQAKPKTNRENIENQLKQEIFKKIRETMNSSHAHSGLQIARATMHFNSKATKPTSQRRQRIKRLGSQQQVGEQKARRLKSIRIRTQAPSFRPYHSYYQYNQQVHRQRHKKVVSERKFETQRSYQKGQTVVKGWIISNDDEQDFQQYH